MDEFMNQASQKGMYVVDNENTDALYEEYEEQLVEADELCEIIDPETRPYDSKYKAREILDKICNKLEANRTIASLEKKKSIIESLDFRIAAIRIRTGTISWECEEPHNAQTDLDLACEFYVPGLVKLIDETSAEGESVDGTEPSVIPVDELQKPEVPLLPDNFRADAMKCLNILGILWAGRSQVRKSFLYLLAANDFYEKNIVGVPNKGKIRREMDNSFTHNLFYLAQAYGHVGDSKKSSYYCHMTLQRQFNGGLNDIKTALDWVKNCAGIADFYQAMKQYNNCALALASAERIFKERVIEELRSRQAASGSTDGPVNYVSGNLNAAEIEADLHKRWALLDAAVLKRGYERENVRKTALELGVTLSEMETREFLENGEGDYVLLPVQTADTVPLTVFEVMNLVDKPSADSSAVSKPKGGTGVQFFSGLVVEPTSMLNGGEINSFDQARVVFLRSAARIEAAKKYYVLDGYVTDHSTLTQEHSKLYHYLAGFETDGKRKLAMETRRVDMLLPLIKSLNKVSYEVLHKQISYELGETSLCQLEIRLDKLRGPGGDINEKKIKKSELTKCNELCKTGYAMFTHFAFLYAQAKDRTPQTGYTHFETLQMHQLAGIACMEPDETLISEEEVRPFLNVHFLACRALTKAIPSPEFLPPAAPGATVPNRAHFLVAALRRYEWLSRFVPKICERRGVDVSAVFGEEWTICQDMVKLLPSKIDRMMYLGESGLSL